MIDRINQYNEVSLKGRDGRLDGDQAESPNQAEQNVAASGQAGEQTRAVLAQTPQSVPNAASQRRADYNGRIFDSDNIGISSKSRMVDATLTAYKLLDSAFVNQRGNPNHLEERFKIQDTDKMIKEILGERPKNTATPFAGRASRTSRAAPVQTMRGHHRLLVQANPQNAKANTSVDEHHAHLHPRSREQMLPPNTGGVIQEDLRANEEMHSMGQGPRAVPPGVSKTFRIRRHSAHPVASRVRNRKKVSARALYDLLNIGSS